MRGLFYARMRPALVGRPGRKDTILKLYIAGPMSGLPDFNYPAFHAAEAQLKALGHETLNPANNAQQDGWEGYMRAGIAQVIQADGIAYLPGSEGSRGARLELHIAAELSLDVRPLDEWLTAA